MLQYHWNSITITTNQQANDMIKLFNRLQPKIGAFDTETNGLHITLSTPFLFQFGFLDPNSYEGYSFAVDLERQPKLARAVIRVWQDLAKSLDRYLAHNVKFDLHMMANLGEPYVTENLSDTMFYIRYGHDMLTPKNGGPPLGLKDYASRYIDHKAKSHEKLLDSEKSAIAKELNLKLKYRLRNCGEPPEKYGARSYTLSVIQQMFKDPIADYTDLPENVKGCYLEWLHQDVPIYLQNKIVGIVESDLIPYNTLNRDNLIKYAHYDIIYTLELYASLNPIVHNRGNDVGIGFEDKLIIPLWEMERVGFKADRDYIERCRVRVKEYIKERRQVLYEIAGQELSIGQHALIKDILNNDLGASVFSTNGDELDLLHSDLVRSGDNPIAVKFIEIVQELRTLEKWYSTYIQRFLKDLQQTDRLHTTINQVGTVSGRVTSDFQQFPKEAIKTVDGEELFHPRRMVIPSGGDYDGIVYLDYSQIELRFQAFYTVLVGNPDLNLCRAYMPYKCVNSQGEEFDCSNIDHIQSWNSDWFLSEDPSQKWIPTDVHGATTEKATGLSPDHPDFKELRSKIGKKVNFAKNYGAQFGRIRQMFPEKTDEEIRRIDNAYYDAFPGVKAYHTYCYNRAQEFSYTTNLFGVKYYGVNGHKLINMLIQGSSAYYLKRKIRELYDYCKANNIKSRFQMNIHDELSWERHTDELEVFFEFQKIMQDWPDTQVPIVAEMDATHTTWADKKGVHSIEDLQVCLGIRSIG